MRDKDVSEKQKKQEDETRQCASNSPPHFDQTSCMSENIDETVQDTELSPETKSVELALEKSVTHQSKDEKFKAQSLHLHIREEDDVAKTPVHCGDDQVKEKTLTGDDTAACVKQCDGSCLLLLSKSIKIDENSLLGDAKISGMANFKDCQHSQSTEKEDQITPSRDKDTSLNIPQLDFTSPEKETHPGPVVVLAKDAQHQNQQKGSMMNTNHFASASVAACACNDKPDKNVTATEDLCRNKDKPSDSMGPNEAFNETRVDSANDACDHVSVGAPMSHPHMSSCRHQQTEASDVTPCINPALTSVINPSICYINTLSLDHSEPSEHDKDDASSPGVGAESGISSMAVGPNLQVGGNELDMAVNTAVFPGMDYHAQPETKTEALTCHIADDAASLLVNENAADGELESCQSVNPQKPLGKTADWAKNESAAANEDVFGHEIDDSYNSVMDRYMAPIASSFTSDLKEKMNPEASVKKMEKMQAQNEECEKTEISIMEATMDNNEWITDSNSQVLPWMNICVSPLAQDNQTSSHLPPEADKHEGTDTPPSAQVKPTHPLCLGEDTRKKVVAVQPMPQNVNVTFRIHYVAHSPYQTVAVTGNQQELGNWKEFIPLERAKDGHWAAVVSLPAESHVEWKFVLLDKGEVCRWEECGNRLLDTGFGEDVILHEWWGLS